MLKRDKQNAVIGGVCAGVAQSLGLSVLLVRVLAVFGLLWVGLTFWLYLLAWLLLPIAEPKHFLDNLDTIRRQNGIFAGVCGGLAVYLGVSAFLVRLLWLFCICWMGFGLIPYVILIFCIPKKTAEAA